jgi:hypothetical protein
MTGMVALARPTFAVLNSLSVVDCYLKAVLCLKKYMHFEQ